MIIIGNIGLHIIKQKFPELLCYPENPRCLRHTLKFGILKHWRRQILFFTVRRKKQSLASEKWVQLTKIKFWNGICLYVLANEKELILEPLWENLNSPKHKFSKSIPKTFLKISIALNNEIISCQIKSIARLSLFLVYLFIFQAVF